MLRQTMCFRINRKPKIGLSILEIVFRPIRSNNNLLIQFAFVIENGTFYQLDNCFIENYNDYFIGLIYKCIF